jgi:hypothetical protein
VATAAVRLSQVVGALEYKGEAERLKQTQMALRRSLEQLADAPLAQQEPALVARIIQRSNELQQSVTEMLERGQRRHLERNALLSSLYQSQSYLRHLQDINRRYGSNVPDAQQLMEMDRLIAAAIDTPSPRATVQQLDAVTAMLPRRATQPVVKGFCPILTPSWQARPAVEAAGRERSGDKLVYVPHQGAGGDPQQRY